MVAVCALLRQNTAKTPKLNLPLPGGNTAKTPKLNLPSRGGRTRLQGGHDGCHSTSNSKHVKLLSKKGGKTLEKNWKTQKQKQKHEKEKSATNKQQHRSKVCVPTEASYEKRER